MKKKITINTKVKYTTSDKYQKHFTLDDRIRIQKIITEHRDEFGNLTMMLKDIGNMLENDPSTISKEVKKHRIKLPRNYDSYPIYNRICKNYDNCQKTLSANSRNFCRAYSKCIDICQEFVDELCVHLNKFPWVCNGCPKSKGCRKTKFMYYSDVANKDYKETLRVTREGISLTPDEFKALDHTISSYVKQGQPIYHIIESNDIPVSQRTIYYYFEKGYFEAKNIDLRRKVTYKKRYQHRIDKTLSRKIKQGRKYEDYIEYMKMNPDASVVEMDTVESAEDSNRVLLTLHFVKFHFQLAYLLESKEAIGITNTFNSLCNNIGIENFKKLFEVILTDNGTEFSNPEAIEYEPVSGELRSNVFFCHPYSSGEKGACEKNHEYIRYVLPKGTVFDTLTQDKVYLMMSHINSTKRPSVNGSPYDFMALTYGTELLDLLKIKKIEPKDIVLTPRLLNI